MEALARLLRLTREVSVFIGVVVLVIYFFPTLDGLSKQLTPVNVESVSIPGLLWVKLKADITTYAPTNITLEALSGSAADLEKGLVRIT